MKKTGLIVEMVIVVLGVIGVMALSWAYFSGSISNLGDILSINSGKVQFLIDEEKVNADNLMPIYNSNYSTEGYKHIFTIDREGKLDACFELNLVIDSIGTNIANQYLHYRLEYGSIYSEGTFQGKSANDKINLITNQSSSEGDTEKEYTLYIWLEYNEEADQTSILTGNASSRTLVSHLEIIGSVDKCISNEIPVTAYTVNGSSTEISYNTLYSKLGTEYEANVTCQNGSVYTYNNGSISLETLVVPDKCTINFTDKTYTVSGASNNNSYGTVTTSSNITYGGTTTLTVTPSTGYYLSNVGCTNNYTTNASIGPEYYNIQIVTVSNNNNANNSVCAFSFSPREFTITFDKVESDATLSTTSKQVTYNSTYGTLPEPQRTAYNFVGWYTEGGVQITSASTVDITDNQTLYAHWSIKTYNVTLSITGGSTSSTNPQTVNYNGEATFNISANAGYNLSGATISGSGCTLNSAKTQVTASNVTSARTCTVTLPLMTYTVGYNACDGSGTPSSQTKTHGTDLTLSSTTPTRSGYDFQGWSTSSCSGSVNYQPSGSYTANEAATMYAVWKLKTYTISYNANNGSNAPSSQTKTHGEDLTLTSSIPTRSLYNFSSWNTNSSGSGTSYSRGGTYTANNDQVLYAQWSQPTIALNTSTNSNIVQGGQIYYYKYIPSSTKTYVFKSTLSSGDSYGYIYNSSGSQITKDDDSGEGSNFRISNSLTSGETYYLGVKYYGASTTGTIPVRLLETYQVTYNACSGTGAPSSQTKVYGETLTLSSTTPTYAGHTFSGWSTSSCSATSTNYAASGSYTSNSAAILYAIYSTDTYSISASSNNTNYGTVSNLSSSSIAYGGSVTVTVAPKTGYYYTGYTCTNSYTTNATANSTSSQTVTISNNNQTNGSSCTFNFAARTFTVTFNANTTDTVSNLSPTSKSVTYNSTYGTLPTPTRTGYDFTGWYTDSTNGTQKTSSSTVSITANETLYAHWSLKTYTVTGAVNNSSYGSITSSSSINYGGTTTLTVTPASGYYLSAFSCTNGYTHNASVGTSYTSAQTVTISNNNIENTSTCTATFTLLVLDASEVGYTNTLSKQNCQTVECALNELRSKFN